MPTIDEEIAALEAELSTESAYDIDAEIAALEAEVSESAGAEEPTSVLESASNINLKDFETTAESSLISQFGGALSQAGRYLRPDLEDEEVGPVEALWDKGAEWAGSKLTETGEDLKGSSRALDTLISDETLQARRLYNQSEGISGMTPLSAADTVAQGVGSILAFGPGMAASLGKGLTYMGGLAGLSMADQAREETVELISDIPEKDLRANVGFKKYLDSSDSFEEAKASFAADLSHTRANIQGGVGVLTAPVYRILGAAAGGKLFKFKPFNVAAGGMTEGLQETGENLPGDFYFNSEVPEAKLDIVDRAIKNFVAGGAAGAAVSTPSAVLQMAITDPMAKRTKKREDATLKGVEAKAKMDEANAANAEALQLSKGMETEANDIALARRQEEQLAKTKAESDRLISNQAAADATLQRDIGLDVFQEFEAEENRDKRAKERAATEQQRIKDSNLQVRLEESGAQFERKLNETPIPRDVDTKGEGYPKTKTPIYKEGDPRRKVEDAKLLVDEVETKATVEKQTSRKAKATAKVTKAVKEAQDNPDSIEAKEKANDAIATLQEVENTINVENAKLAEKKVKDDVARNEEAIAYKLEEITKAPPTNIKKLHRDEVKDIADALGIPTEVDGKLVAVGKLRTAVNEGLVPLREAAGKPDRASPVKPLESEVMTDAEVAVEAAFKPIAKEDTVEAPVEATAPVTKPTPTPTITEEKTKGKFEGWTEEDGTVFDGEGEIVEGARRKAFMKSTGIKDTEALDKKDRERSEVEKARTAYNRARDKFETLEGKPTYVEEQQFQKVKDRLDRAIQDEKDAIQIATMESMIKTNEALVNRLEGVDEGVAGQQDVEIGNLEDRVDELEGADIEAVTVEEVEPKLEKEERTKLNLDKLEAMSESEIDVIIDGNHVLYEVTDEVAQKYEDRQSVEELSQTEGVQTTDYKGKPVELHRGLKDGGTPRGYAGTFYSEDTEVAAGYAKTSTSDGTVETITFTPEKVFDVDAVQDWNEEGKIAMGQKLLAFMEARNINIEDSYVYDVLNGETDFAYPIAADSEFLLEQGYDSVRYEKEAGVTQKGWFILPQDDMAMATSLPTEYDMDYYDALRNTNSAQEVVDITLERTKNPVTKQILERIQSIVRSGTTFRVILKDDMPPRMKERFKNSAGSYDYMKDEVKIYPDMESEVNEEALVHELLHSVTNDAIMQDRELRRELTSIQKSIEEYYLNSEQERDAWDNHIMKVLVSNKKELITYAFTNPEVQVKLQRIPHKRSGMDIFNAFVNLIMKAFNLKADSKSALAGIIMQGEKAFQHTEAGQQLEKDIATGTEGTIEFDDSYVPTDEEMAMFDMVQDPTAEPEADPTGYGVLNKGQKSRVTNKPSAIDENGEYQGRVTSTPDELVERVREKSAGNWSDIADLFKKGLAYVVSDPYLHEDLERKYGLETAGQLHQLGQDELAKAQVRTSADMKELVEPANKLGRVRGEAIVNIAHMSQIRGKDMKGSQQYNKLDSEQRAVYDRWAEQGKQQQADYIQVFKNMLEQEATTTAQKKDLNELINKFESNEDYFPFQRKGDYRLIAKMENGEWYVSRSTNRADLFKEAEKAKELGWDEINVSREENRASDAQYIMSPSDLEMGKRIIDEQIPDGGADADAAKVALWSIMTEMARPTNLKKRTSKRLFVAGASKNLTANTLTSTGFHNEIMKLQYAPERARVVQNIVKSQKAMPASTAEEAKKKLDAEISVKEVLAREKQWNAGGTRAGWSKRASQASYILHLALSGGTGLINTTQPHIVGIPYFISQGYSPMASAKAVLKAQKDVRLGFRIEESLAAAVSHYETTTSVRTGEEMLYYNQDEANMLKKAALRLANTEAGMMTDMNEVTSNADYGVKRFVNKTLGILQHRTEVGNRQATALAAYRLAIDAGKGHEQATDEAIDSINKVNFDFSESGKSRWQKGNIGSVLSNFKSHPIKMAEVQARAFKKIVGSWEATPEEREQAIVMFAGMQIMNFAYAGMVGVPMVGAIGALYQILGDDDDDLEEWMDKSLKSVGVSDEISFGVRRGVIPAILGIDISERVGLGGSLFRMPRDASSATEWVKAIANTGGPITARLGKIPDAAKMMDEGNYGDAFDALLTPAFAKNARKAKDWYSEGKVYDRFDNTILGEFDEMDALKQSIGLSPMYKREASREFYAAKGKESKQKRRRYRLLREVSYAVVRGSASEKRKARTAIREWNRSNRDDKITQSSIKRSIRQFREDWR